MSEDTVPFIILSVVIGYPLFWLLTGCLVFEVLDRSEDRIENWLLVWLWPLTLILASPIALTGVVILAANGIKWSGWYLKSVGSLYKEVIKHG